MSAAILRHPAYVEWPADPRDLLPLTLWDSEAIAKAVNGQASCAFQVAGVEMDSRDVVNGDLFIALKGEAMDGHRFLAKAFENGAAAAIVDRPVDYPHVLVQDTTEALKALATMARSRTQAKIIGVTGSVGKTGVKEAIFASLERASRGAAHRSTRSYNNHVGVPLSLARMPARSRFGIFEMGMNNAGEIEGLSKQVRPNIAVITTIAPAHIENLGSMEAIAEAKAEIFSGLERGGIAVIPADSEYFERLRLAAIRMGAKIISFGRAPHADIRLLDAIPSANGGSLVTCEFDSGRLCYTVAEPGDHWVINSLAVMAAVRAAGGDMAAAGLALAEMGGLKGRGARHGISVPGGTALMIDESYNANPASMRATLAQLGQTPSSRRIAVLGSMKELGDFADRFHGALSEPLIAADVDYAIFVGEEMRALARELGKPAFNSLGKPLEWEHCNTAGEAIGLLEQFGIIAGDAVLVKGSNSVGLGKLVDHFT
ncbi:UDP-N-acetylmuramoyl-tripeptide--D-alanyl-D-alanine ligase [Qipengyuania sp. 483]